MLSAHPMAKPIDLIFLNAFVLLNALFCAVPSALRVCWPWTEVRLMTSSQIALTRVPAKVELRRRVIRSEPHAAP
jgi:hypothetical protein